MRSALKHKQAINFVRPLILVSFLCVLCASVVDLAAQDWKAVHDGVEYAQVELKLGEDPVKINLLRLDLTMVRLDVNKALDKAIGLETTSSIATRKGAVAAINAGYFRLDNSAWAGDATGSLMIDGKVLSENSNERISIVITNGKRETEVIFLHLNTYGVLGFAGALHATVFSGVNREVKPNEVVLYSPQFGPTTMTQGVAGELVLSKCKPKQSWPETSGLVCRTAELRKASSNNAIPVDGFVISIGPEATAQMSDLELKYDSSGRYRSAHRPLIRFYLRDRETKRSIIPNDSTDVTNGIPRLINNGKIDITWEQEKASRAFVFNRHPRTAVAKMKDGKFLMITVDGRQPGVSVGMTLQELAEYLLSIGATDAMNLDGGGSTTMVLDGKVVNKPSDPTGERKIGDAIVVTLRKTARPASRNN